MKYINGYLLKNMDRWKDKEWYHQRFDGSPYYMWMVSEGEMSSEKRKEGTEFSVHFVFFENDRVDWYIAIEDNKRITARLIELGKENPKISSDMISLWKKDETLFFKKCIDVSKTDISNLSDTDLIKLHDELMNCYIKRISSSSTIDGFALGSDEMVAEKIRKVCEKKKLKMRFTEVFSTLTAPVQLSFINEADLSLLRVVLGEKPIEEHQRNYFWLNNNYVDWYVLDKDYFKKEIERIKSMKLDINKQIKKIESISQENKIKKKKLIKDLGIDAELKLLIKISEDFTYWQDERKRSTLWATHYFSLILNEMGGRLGFNLREMQYMTHFEVSDIFDNKPDKKVLQERMKNSVYYMDNTGTEALFGDDVGEIKARLFVEGEMDTDDFRGLSASLGKAIGKVKIVKSVKEINKIEEGDILVTVMTRPDYVPAMKKAAAIVTDEGGITSHAAIISRELCVPCVIGTKIATKVLKDGMLVEVNANHGWVKIIKKE